MTGREGEALGQAYNTKIRYVKTLPESWSYFPKELGTWRRSSLKHSMKLGYWLILTNTDPGAPTITITVNEELEEIEEIQGNREA
jgi:hypothetical protein